MLVSLGPPVKTNTLLNVYLVTEKSPTKEYALVYGLYLTVSGDKESYANPFSETITLP